MAYWERLHEILNREVVAERDRFFMAKLKRVGLEKDKPFNPTPRQKKILKEAAFVGEAIRRGQRAKLLAGEPVEELLPLPLAEARERLGISDPHASHPRVPTEGMLIPSAS